MKCRFHPWVFAPCFVLLSGCLLGDEQPILDNRPPASCGNGRCDIVLGGGENCVNCPADCACCTAVDARGTAGESLDAVLGPVDQRVVPLSPGQELTLTLGSTAQDGPVAGASEIQIHGTVSSSDKRFDGCPMSAGAAGAVEVWAGTAGAEKLIGLWTSASTQFDLACGQVVSAQYLRLRAQEGVVAQLDAVTIDKDACLGELAKQ